MAKNLTGDRASRSKVSKKKRFKIHESNNWQCHYCKKQLTPIPLGCKSVGSQWENGVPVQIYTNPSLRIRLDDFPYLDHKTPVSKGGTNANENLTTACWACNSKKKDRYSEQEFLSLIGQANGEHGSEKTNSAQ